LPGKSGTNWQVDAYGDDINEQRILLECKHYKRKKSEKGAALEQNIIAAFAYIIKDVGASRGIVVTTQGLQEGASKVAKYEGIELLQLDYNSTDKNFVIRFSENNQAVAIFTEEFGGIFRIMYSKSKIIDILQNRDEMTEDEAYEFYAYNILGMHVCEQNPIFLVD
jgi:hypothetical protein